MIDVRLDEMSWLQIDMFLEGVEMWDLLMNRGLSEEIGKEAKDHFTPMMHARPTYTGELEKSVETRVFNTGAGFEIEYWGFKYGQWVDTGNFPPGAVIMRVAGKGAPFPIREMKGADPVKFSRTIHGMGSVTPGAPTHYSEKTVTWLADGKATEVALEHLEVWLRSVVLP